MAFIVINKKPRNIGGDKEDCNISGLGGEKAFFVLYPIPEFCKIYRP